MSELFLCGVIVNEQGDPVIGIPISKIATKNNEMTLTKWTFNSIEGGGCGEYFR